MDSFLAIWTLLDPKGEYKRRQTACRRLWAGYDLDTQRLIYANILARQRERQALNPNPYFEIEDTYLALQRKAVPQGAPTFLHGRALYDAMNRGEYLVQVDIPDRAEGRYPIVTKEDAERFGLKIEKDWMKKIEN